MRAKRALAFTRSHQLASQDRVGSGGRSHDLRLSPAGTTSMLPASLQPASATRMTTEEPGDQLSSEVRGSRCWTRTIPDPKALRGNRPVRVVAYRQLRDASISAVP